jgi:hypothetical protein
MPYESILVQDQSGGPHRTTDEAIVFVAGRLVAVCDLIDASPSGARLGLRDTVDLPVEFVLFLARLGRVHRQCRVVRRAGAEIFVDFGS